MPRIEAKATLPSILSAIKISGEDGAIRVQLDLYGDFDLNELLALRGKVLKVIFEEEGGREI